MEKNNKKESSPFARVSFVLASIFLGAALIGGGYLAFVRGAHFHGQEKEENSEALHSSSLTLSGRAQCVPTLTSSTVGQLPELDELKIREGLTIPSADGIGPALTEGFPRCWAHSPHGAVLAGASIITQLYVQEDPVSVVETYVEDSPVRQKLLATQDQVNPEAKSQVLLLGYKFKHVEDNFVSLELAVGAQWISDAPVSVSATMVWNESVRDWKLLLNDAGWNLMSLPLNVSDAGFTELKWR